MNFLNKSILLFILLAAGFAETGIASQTQNASVGDAQVVDDQVVVQPTDKLTSKYTDVDGVEHTICTVLKTGESISSWTSRHKVVVKEMKDAFKPANSGS